MVEYPVEYPESFVEFPRFKHCRSFKNSSPLSSNLPYPSISINSDSSTYPSSSESESNSVTTLGGRDSFITLNSRFRTLRNDSILNCRNFGIERALGTGLRDRSHEARSAHGTTRRGELNIVSSRGSPIGIERI